MTERRGDPGFSIAPRRLGDEPPGRGPRRTRQLGVALVALAAIAIVTVAFVGPRLSGRPSFEVAFFATPTPDATPTPKPSASTDPRSPSPGPTPLPTFTRPEGVQLEGSIALLADGFQVLDLASGSALNGPRIVRGQDAVVEAVDGNGWTCVCLTSSGQGPGDSLGLDLIRIDPDGRNWHSAGSGGGAPFDDVRVGSGYNWDVDLAGDRRHALIAASTQLNQTGPWPLTVHPLDLVSGRLGEGRELGVVPVPIDPRPHPSVQPSRNPEFGPEQNVYLDGPNVRVAPDGRSAYVWATASLNGEEGTVASENRAWRIVLDDKGAITDVEESPAFRTMVGFCWSVGFISADRVAVACPTIGRDPSGFDASILSIRILDGAGRLANAADIPNTGSFDFMPLIDRANGLMYFWSAMGLTLTRLDLATFDVVTTSFDPAATSSAGIATGGPKVPDWATPDSITARFSYPQLAGEPGSSRLFLVGSDQSAGYESGNAASLGILVVDGSTLALVDRWAPAANYLMLANPRPGIVAAIGAAGVDVAGRPAPWLGSVTLHDATTGSILARYAQFPDYVQPWIIESAVP